jgi:hypothetical protein
MDAADGPTWVQFLWFIAGPTLVGVTSWVGLTLSALRKSAAEQIRLLKWMKAHEEDEVATFNQITSLMEKNVRLARSALEMVRWMAREQTGKEPPPVGE